MSKTTPRRLEAAHSGDASKLQATSPKRMFNHSREKTMFKRTILITLTGSILALSSALVPAQTQTQDQAQDQTKQQTQQRIYGSQLMTKQERLEYRARMRAAKTQQEREQIRTEHHQRMQERAKARGMTLPDMPPFQPGRGGMGPAMGPGTGMGPGGGMGPGTGGMGPGGGMGGGRR
jgi:hypothetical protein